MTKNLIKTICVAMLVIVMGVAMSGCDNDEVRMRKAFQQELREDGMYLKLSDIYIATNYGTYNDCIVVAMDAKGVSKVTWVHTEIVGGINFSAGLFGIRAWKANKFYSLLEAYNDGLLTKEDLLQIEKLM